MRQAGVPGAYELASNLYRAEMHDKIARTVVVRVAHEPEITAAPLAQA